MSEDRKQKADAFDYLNFSFVLVLAFFAAYPFFWDFTNVDTRQHAIAAFYWSMGFIFIVAILLIVHYIIIIKKKTH